MRSPVSIINILIIITLFISITLVFKSKNYKRFLKSLSYYLIGGLIMFTFINFRILKLIFPNQNLTTRIIFELYNCIFCFLELNFFIEFFQKHQPLKNRTKLLKKTPVIFLCLLVVYLFYILTFQSSEKTIIYLSVFLNLLEYIIILAICLIFFYSIMINKIESEPIDKYVLINISSFFVYISVSLPFLIIAEKIKIINQELFRAIFFIHYIVILMVILTIAYTLKNKKKLYYA